MEGIWQHLSSEECAEASMVALDQADDDQAEGDEPAPTSAGETAQLAPAEVELETAEPVVASFTLGGSSCA
ncbi:hypothetical protein ABZT43_37625 [Streptomyces sp. NPDC005349]|uniref:hypothetical protein n=1 Tax=Streptomyces sp. NPDC005349 TaxID=3157037 RepID=UPI0033B899D2